MRYHPEIVERAVLHGLEGPDHTYDSPAGLLKALERIAAEAEVSPALEGRLPEEGLIGALRFVIESLDEKRGAYFGRVVDQVEHDPRTENYPNLAFIVLNSIVFMIIELVNASIMWRQDMVYTIPKEHRWILKSMILYSIPLTFYFLLVNNPVYKF